MRGRKPYDAAALEASEEAGLIGEIEHHPIGAYHYLKQFKDAPPLDVQVTVFPFQVTYQADDWKERGQRFLDWAPYQHAAHLVAEPALKDLIMDFGTARTPPLFARALRALGGRRTAGA